MSNTFRIQTSKNVNCSNIPISYNLRTDSKKKTSNLISNNHINKLNGFINSNSRKDNSLKDFKNINETQSTHTYHDNPIKKKQIDVKNVELNDFIQNNVLVMTDFFKQQSTTKKSKSQSTTNKNTEKEKVNLQTFRKTDTKTINNYTHTTNNRNNSGSHSSHLTQNYFTLNNTRTPKNTVITNNYNESEYAISTTNKNSLYKIESPNLGSRTIPGMSNNQQKTINYNTQEILTHDSQQETKRNINSKHFKKKENKKPERNLKFLKEIEIKPENKENDLNFIATENHVFSPFSRIKDYLIDNIYLNDNKTKQLDYIVHELEKKAKSVSGYSYSERGTICTKRNEEQANAGTIGNSGNMCIGTATKSKILNEQIIKKNVHVGHHAVERYQEITSLYDKKMEALNNIKRNSYNIKKEYSSSINKALKNAENNKNLIIQSRHFATNKSLNGSKNDINLPISDEFSEKSKKISKFNSNNETNAIKIEKENELQKECKSLPYVNNLKDNHNKIIANQNLINLNNAEFEENKNPIEKFSNTNIEHKNQIQNDSLGFTDNIELLVDDDNEEDNENASKRSHSSGSKDNSLLSKGSSGVVSDIINKYKNQTACSYPGEKKKLTLLKSSKYSTKKFSEVEHDREVEEICKLFEGNTEIQRKISQIKQKRAKKKLKREEDPLDIDLGVDIEYNETLKKYFCEGHKNLLVEPSNSIQRDYENIKAKNKNLLNSIDFYKKAIIKMNQDIIDYKENSVQELEEIKNYQRKELNKLIQKFIEINPSIKNLVDIDSYNKFVKEKEQFKNKAIGLNKTFKVTLNLLVDEWNKLQSEDYILENLSENTNKLKSIVKKILYISDESAKLNYTNELQQVFKELNKDLEIAEKTKEHKKNSIEEEEEKLVINKEIILSDIAEMRNDDIFTNQSNYNNELELKLRCDIPSHYNNLLSNLRKIEEKETSDGTVTYFNNSIRMIISKDNKTHSKIFQDGFFVTYYNDKNMKIKYPDGDTIFYYSSSRSFELRNLTKNYTILKFKDNQLEKHFKDGTKFIRFANETLKIIKPTLEEIVLNGKNVKVFSKHGTILFDFEI